MSCPSASIFSWPPLSENERLYAATASPIYIPPPGTQRIQSKTYTDTQANNEQITSNTIIYSMETDPIVENTLTTTTSNQKQIESTQIQNVIDLVPSSWLTQESRSAPELTSINLKEHNELTESCSDSYTSTCATTTTTTTTSEEYQRMYSAHSALAQSQLYYDQSSIDLNSSNCDYEVLSIQQQHGSFSSGSTDLILFSGRRSAQECSDSLYNTINTCQLVDYIKNNVPYESEAVSYPSKSGKKVEFCENITRVDTDSLVKSESQPSETSETEAQSSIQTETFEVVDVKLHSNQSNSISNSTPKEWKSLMCRALTTASDKPFQMQDLPETVDECNEHCKNTVESEQENTETYEKKALQQETQDSQNNVQSALDEKVEIEQQQQIESNEIKNVPPIKGFLASLLTKPTDESLSQWVKPTKDFVAMPEQTIPYFPPNIPIHTIEKHEPIRTKSPFLEALTVASVRPFTSFENDVITQFEDLPRSMNNSSLVEALTTAPIEPVNQLNPDLPDETESERIIRIEKENHEKHAAEVRRQILKTVDDELCKKCVAFPPFKGFRKVEPFKSLQLQCTPNQISSRSSSVCAGNVENIPQSSNDFLVDQTQSTHRITQDHHQTLNNACNMEDTNYNNNKKKSTVFPPPSGTPAKSYVQSGLQSPKTIPKYQRQWFNLASQSPIRTPEPHELRENVPLAFCDVLHENTDSIEKPIAITISAPTDTAYTREATINESKKSSIGE